MHMVNDTTQASTLWMAIDCSETPHHLWVTLSGCGGRQLVWRKGEEGVCTACLALHPSVRRPGDRRPHSDGSVNMTFTVFACICNTHTHTYRQTHRDTYIQIHLCTKTPTLTHNQTHHDSRLYIACKSHAVISMSVHIFFEYIKIHI